MPFIDRSYIYVIIDMVKNNLRKTEYKVSNFTVGDSWVRLKRGRGKSGIEFRVLRKVYFPPEKEICKPTPPTPAAPENSE